MHVQRWLRQQQCTVFVWQENTEEIVHTSQILSYLRSEFFKATVYVMVRVRTYSPRSKGPGPQRAPNEESIAYFMYLYMTSIIQFSNSHEMLNQQKQEIAQTVPDPLPHEGVGSGDEIIGPDT